VLAHELADLNPAYFALVMATGTVSNALFLHGQFALSNALFALNAIIYPWLWLLTLLRAGRFLGAMWRDLTSPRRAFLFFTAVAATNVFATSIFLRGLATPRARNVAVRARALARSHLSRLQRAHVLQQGPRQRSRSGQSHSAGAGCPTS